MANENAKMIKDLKNNLKVYASQFGEKISYDSMYKDIEQRLAMSADQREAALKEYYLEMATRLSTKSAELRSYIFSSESIASKYQAHPATATSTTKTFAHAALFIKNIAAIIDPSFVPTNNIFGATPEEIRDRSLDVVKQFTFYNQTPKYIMRWKRESFEGAINRLKNTVKDYRYEAGQRSSHDTKNVAIAEVYRKTLLVKEELAKHGAIWRFFHPFKTSMYNNFLNGANECFEKAGFDPQAHHEDAIDLLKGRLCYPLDVDDEQVKKTCENMIQAEKVKKTPEIKVARDKMAKGLELDKDPKTSLSTKIAPIAQKLGVEIDMNKLNTVISRMSGEAQNYDKMREMGLFTSFPQQVFYCVFKDMLKQSVDKGLQVNVYEILKASHDISVIASHHYTPLYELDEAKEFTSNVGLNSFDEESIQGRIKYIVGEDMPSEKLEQMKKDASDAMKKFAEDSEKLMNEDKELISSVFENEAPNIERMNISVDINSKENIELAPPSTTSKVIEKDKVV